MRAWCVAVLFGLVGGSRSNAHELDVASAKVTLRDGHVVVEAHVDLLPHLQAQRGPSDVPLGLLAVVDPDAFVALARTAGRAFQQGTVLMVDGAPVHVNGWHLPDPVDLQVDAQRAWMAQTVGDHVHPTLVAVSFEARVNQQPESVTLSLPRTVGPVLVSFVHPVGQLSTPGAAVRLSVPNWSTSATQTSSRQGINADP